MLPNRVLNALEQDYQLHISKQKIRLLGGGDNGSVYSVEFDDNDNDHDLKKICVKSIIKGNGTASIDYDLYKAVYHNLINFKFYADEDDRYDFFTLPFFPGETLEKILQTRDVNEEMRFTIFKMILDAAKEMHRCGVLHRDLKAANIIVNLANISENQISVVGVKIIDFGRGVRVFDDNGKAAVSCQDLALPNSNNVMYQFFRKYQSQTPTEMSSVWNTIKSWIGKSYFSNSSEEIIGFRSDYYALATLFRQLLPEHANLANDIINKESTARNDAFHEFCQVVDNAIQMIKFNRELEKEKQKEYRTPVKGNI